MSHPFFSFRVLFKAQAHLSKSYCVNILIFLINYIGVVLCTQNITDSYNCNQ